MRNPNCCYQVHTDVCFRGYCSKTVPISGWSIHKERAQGPTLTLTLKIDAPSNDFKATAGASHFAGRYRQKGITHGYPEYVKVGLDGQFLATSNPFFACTAKAEWFQG